MMPTRPTVAQTSMPQQQVIQPGTHQVIISKDGKIIGPQLVQGQQVVISPSNTDKISFPSVAQNPMATTTMVASPQQQAQPVTPSSQQKVQIVQSADDKIQVRGQLPSQQLFQIQDGKLQILSQQNVTQQPRQQPAEIKEQIEKMQVKTVTLTEEQPPPSVVKEAVPNSTSILEPVVDASPPATLLQNSYEAIARGSGVAAPVAAYDLLNNEVNNKSKRDESDDTSESSGTPQLPKPKKRRSLSQAKDL